MLSWRNSRLILELDLITTVAPKSSRYTTSATSSLNMNNAKLHSFAQHPTMAKHTPSKDKESLLPAWVNPDLDHPMVAASGRGPSHLSICLRGRSSLGLREWRQRGSPASYSMTQAGRDLHFELNSNIHCVNHFCDPTLEWDMSRMEIRVRRDRDLKKGDMLSFFYPSTEWELAKWTHWRDVGWAREGWKLKRHLHEISWTTLSCIMSWLALDNPVLDLSNFCVGLGL